MFNALDKDRNGIVEPEELKSTFAELGVPLSDDDVTVMMREADVRENKIFYDGNFQLPVSVSADFQLFSLFLDSCQSQSQAIYGFKLIPKINASSERYYI